MMLATIIAIAAAYAPLNCATPETALRAALCADPSLRAADNSLTAAYNALLDRTPVSSRAALDALRGDFERARADCLVQRDNQFDCLRDMTDRQRWTVSGAPFSESGSTPPIASIFFGREATDRAARLSVLLPQFADPKRPGERILNRTVLQFYRQTPYPARTKQGFRIVSTFGATGEVVYATPDFISIRVTETIPGEDGSPTRRTVGVNQFLDARTQTRFETIFVKDAATRLAHQCKDRLDAYIRDLYAEIPMASRPTIAVTALEPQIASLESWTFGASGAQAQIALDGQPYVCAFDGDNIRPLLAPGPSIWP